MARPHILTQDLIYELFEKAQSGEEPNLLLPCTIERAKYLSIQAQSLINKYTRESVLMFEPEHPLYCLGIYHDLSIKIVDRGLLVTRHSHPQNTPEQLVMRAAFKGPLQIKCGTEADAIALATKLRNVRHKILYGTLEEIKASIQGIQVEQAKDVVNITRVISIPINTNSKEPIDILP